MSIVVKPKPVRKVRVSYTLELGPEQWEQLANYARVCGHDFDGAAELVLIKRLLTDEGISARGRAEDYELETVRYGVTQEEPLEIAEDE
jgi:hypothetical protein